MSADTTFLEELQIDEYGQQGQALPQHNNPRESRHGLEEGHHLSVDIQHTSPSSCFSSNCSTDSAASSPGSTIQAAENGDEVFACFNEEEKHFASKGEGSTPMGAEGTVAAQLDITEKAPDDMEVEAEDEQVSDWIS